MSVFEKVIYYIEKYRDYKRKNIIGDKGRYWRDGGNSLLYEGIRMHPGKLVIDAGGYKGEWTEKMLVKYGCTSYLFEPIDSFNELCKEKFVENDKVRIMKYALSNKTGIEKIWLSDNGTSLFKKPGETCVEVDLLDVNQFFTSLPESSVVSCMKVNIEGAEYDVIKALCDSLEIKRIKCLLVQFHEMPEDYELRYSEIQNELSKTHNKVWSYHMMWERWECK
jgi:FkbM family methyltransferase